MKFQPFETSKRSYPTYRAFTLTNNKWKARLYDGLNFHHGLVENNYGTLVFPGNAIPLSKVLVGCNFFPSKGEFNRKLKEGAIKFGENWQDETVIKDDCVLHFKKENLHSVRMGQKYVEFIIPELYSYRKWLYYMSIPLEYLSRVVIKALAVVPLNNRRNKLGVS